ncbi:MAG: sulfite exporter TauE/SafE family protein [Actinomycetota bacterium]|jgi:uncharacterized membrane protein YfcA|nr:sulfite exporter TauE/SafE family protein [Actinomycetota bacterium]
MTLSGGQELLLALAGLGAGFVNGAAGGGTLISFPALLAVGYPALTANVTSTVGIWSGYLGGSAGFGQEVSDQRGRLRVLAATVTAGAVAGGVLLLTTPSHDFAVIVPYLLLAACALFALQPLLARRLRQHGTAKRSRTVVLHAGTFVGAVYGAYFGAGLGVVLLAVLGSTIPEPLIRVNGLRSVVALMVNTIAVVIFVARAHVAWAAAGLMVGCALLGGYAGARVARRVPTSLLRVAIIAIGLASALDLLL